MKLRFYSGRVLRHDWVVPGLDVDEHHGLGSRRRKGWAHPHWGKSSLAASQNHHPKRPSHSVGEAPTPKQHSSLAYPSRVLKPTKARPGRFGLSKCRKGGGETLPTKSSPPLSFSFTPVPASPRFFSLIARVADDSELLKMHLDSYSGMPASSSPFGDPFPVGARFAKHPGPPNASSLDETLSGHRWQTAQLGEIPVDLWTADTGYHLPESWAQTIDSILSISECALYV